MTKAASGGGGMLPIPSLAVQGGSAAPSGATSGIGSTYHINSKGLGVWGLLTLMVIGGVLWKKLK